ncbi:MAG: ABC transporter ATP-binding protein [Pseudomonadota bacterium]
MWMNFFKEHVWRAVKEDKSSLLRLVLALALLGISQAGLVIIIGPMLKVFFVGENEVFKLGELISLLPEKTSNIEITRSFLMLIIPLGLLGLGLGRSFCGYIYNVEQTYLSLEISAKFRSTLFEHIVSVDYMKGASRSPAEWMSVIMNDVAALQEKVSEIVNGLLRDLLALAASFVGLLFVWWPAAIVLLGISPFIAFWTGRTGRKISKWSEEFQRSQAQFQAFAHDFRSRFEFVKAQSGEEVELGQFEKMNRNYLRAVNKSIFTRALFAPSFEFFGFAALAGVILLLPFVEQHLHGTRLVAFFGALAMIFKPLRSIGEQYVGLEQIKGLLSQSLQILSTPIQERVSFQVADGNVTQIKVDSLEVSYDRFSLRCENLVLNPGQLILFAGRSGAGKSSLLKVLAGLVDPNQYSGNVSVPMLRSYVSYVGQAPFLFKGTVRENLNYGQKFPFSDEKIIKSLECVGVYDELLALGGLDLFFDPIKPCFSGGQIQRLSIARGLLRPSQILALDEVTASLDLNKEKEILESLRELAQSSGKIVLVVSHRFDFLNLFDHVYFFVDGQIHLQGSPAHVSLNDDFRLFLEGEK